MPVLVVLVASGSCLLVLAGLNKIRHPEGTAPALLQLTPWANTRVLARAVGLIELGVGLCFLAFPAVWSSALVGAWYAALLAIAWTLRARKTDCGCFGVETTEVTASHLIVTGFIAVCGLALWVIAAEIDRSGSLYWLLAASIPIALGWYGLLVPMAVLRSRVKDLYA
jgi:hypothetical protein